MLKHFNARASVFFTKRDGRLTFRAGVARV